MRAALEAGKHVLCEKPFTTDLAEADDLLNLVRSRPTRQKLQVAFNHRWLSSYYQGAVAIRTGDIGRPVAGYARKNDTIYVPTEMLPWAAQTTPIHFLGAHDIDLMRWFFGSEPLTAYARGVKGVLTARGVDTWDLDSGAWSRSRGMRLQPSKPPGSIPTRSRRCPTRLSRSSALRVTCISIASGNRSR